MIQLKKGSSGLLILIVVLLLVLVLEPLLNRGSGQNILLGTIAGLLAVLVLAPLNRSALEYKVVSAESINQSVLNELGQEGWQLTATDPITTSYVFKR